LLAEENWLRGGQTDTLGWLTAEGPNTLKKLSVVTHAYEHIFIDNHSTDSTAEILTRIAAADPHVKVIINARNFGHIRSPIHALLQATGDAMIGIASDFQEPPDLIPQMLAAWEQGYKMVLCVKRSSGENGLFYWLRKQYYKTVERFSSVETVQNYTGFGLYTREVIDIFRSLQKHRCPARVSTSTSRRASVG
jgi:glycosyltransferase involved in cell wall biosynthesis